MHFLYLFLDFFLEDKENSCFNVTTRDKLLTPLLVAAASNRKNSVLWLLQDGQDCVIMEAVDCTGKNAIHLACLDLECEQTIDVRSIEIIITLITINHIRTYLYTSNMCAEKMYIGKWVRRKKGRCIYHICQPPNQFPWIQVLNFLDLNNFPRC